MTRGRRGFTLIEMMVAVLVGSAGVVLAAKVAQVVITQSAKGRQSTDFHSRTRLVGRQLRADIRSTGIGSTGAVAVDNNIAVWTQMSVLTTAGFSAIPVVAGANNLGGVNIGGATTFGGSDAVQLLVTNPDTAVRTIGFSAANQDILNLDPNDRAINCPSGLIYISDHSAPTGGGRTQLLFVDGYPPNGIDTTGVLQFTVAPGSDVMCARLSVYWTDTQGWMHRSDLSGAAAPIINLGGPVWVDPSNVGPDSLAPGVLDLQVAYRVSAEVYTQNGQVRPVNQPARTWAFEGVAGNADPLMAGTMWFEVRMVRVNLLARTLRRVDAKVQARNVPRREDAAGLGPIVLNRSLGAEWATATETLTNLRYFDYTAPSGAVAEPY